MKHAFFLMPVLDSTNAAKDLNAYCSANRVVEVRKEFVSDGQNSFWSICIVSRTGDGPVKATAKPSRHAKVDYKAVLSEQDFAVYSELRSLRKDIAEREGVPLYHIFTNEQSALIVQNKVSTKAGLLAIEGIGEKRVELYADMMLDRLTALHGLNNEKM